MTAALASATVLAEKQGNQFHPVLSWEPPLDSSAFENWSFQGSSVALTNKIILNPNGNDNFGWMANNWVSHRTNATHQDLSLAEGSVEMTRILWLQTTDC